MLGDDLQPSEYIALAEFRYQIRAFMQFSAQAAEKFGLEAGQHQLLLTAKAISLDHEPTIGEIAARLLLRHHSVVGMLDRMEEGGLVRRARGETDRRQVRVTLTRKGEATLRELSRVHRAELESAGPALVRALQTLLEHVYQDD